MLDSEGETESDAETEREMEAESESLALSDWDSEGDSDFVKVAEGLPVCVSLSVPVREKVPNVSVSEALFESELESDGVSDMDHVYVCEPEYETVRDGVDESVSEYDHDAEPE